MSDFLDETISSNAAIFNRAYSVIPFTVRRLYLTTPEVLFIFSLSFRKLGLAFNLEYLSNFFFTFKNQWQFWNPYDNQIPNLSLIFEFAEELTEIIDNEKDETKLIFEKYQLSITNVQIILLIV